MLLWKIRALNGQVQRQGWIVASSHAEASDVARREKAQKALGQIATRDAHLGERISGRHEVGERQVGTLAARFAPATRKKKRRRRRALQISHPASAIVSMEVFGQPRGLRGWE